MRTRFLLVLQENETGDDALGSWRTVFSKELKTPYNSDAISQGLSLRNQVKELAAMYEPLKKEKS